MRDDLCEIIKSHVQNMEDILKTMRALIRETENAHERYELSRDIYDIQDVISDVYRQLDEIKKRSKKCKQ